MSWSHQGRILVLLVSSQRDKHPGSLEIVHVKDSVGHSFATRLNNLFVIGKQLCSLVQNLHQVTVFTFNNGCHEGDEGYNGNEEGYEGQDGSSCTRVHATHLSVIGLTSSCNVDPETSIQHPESQIQNPASSILNSESSIPNLDSSIPNSESNIQSPPSRTECRAPQVQNRASRTQNPASGIPNRKCSSSIQHPASSMSTLESSIPDAESASRIHKPGYQIIQSPVRFSPYLEWRSALDWLLRI